MVHWWLRCCTCTPAHLHTCTPTHLHTCTPAHLHLQIVKDYENVDDVNRQLEKMGYNIGVRIIEDFLARTGTSKCGDFRETSEKVQQAFKIFLNVSPTVTSWSSASDEFSLIFETNPIAEFVELPDSQAGLKYSNILCGTIRCGQLVQHPVCPGAPWRWCTWRSPPGSPRITSRGIT